MIRLLLLFSIFIVHENIHAQNLMSFSVGRYWSEYKEINEVVKNLNTSRPWLSNQLPTFNGGLYADLTPSIRLNNRYKLSIPASYRRMSSYADNENFSTFVLFRQVQAHAMLEYYPSFAPDTIDPLTSKLFIGLGVGGSLLIPKVFINEEDAQVNDIAYQSLNFTTSFRLMLAYTIPLGNKIDFTPFFHLDIVPALKAKDFDVALHGKRNTSVFKNPTMLYSFGLRLQFRLFPKSLEEDNLSLPY
jgi:hypothetical protein